MLSKIKLKKGELTTKHIIGLILLLAAFAIIVFIYVRVNFIGEINREACHQSILERGTFNLGILEVGRETIPLRCQTEKYCVTDGENEEGCEDLKAANAKYFDIDSSRVAEKKVEVLDFLAEQLFFCHTMLGEGNVMFMPTGKESKNYCFVCSRFAIEKELANEVFDEGKLSYRDFYIHLSKKKDNDGDTYLNRIYERDIFTMFDILTELEEKDSDFKDGFYLDLSNENEYLVMSRIVTDQTQEAYTKGTFATIITTVFVSLAGKGGLISAAKVGGAVGGLVFWNEHPLLGGDNGWYYAKPGFFLFNYKEGSKENIENINEDSEEAEDLKILKKEKVKFFEEVAACDYIETIP